MEFDDLKLNWKASGYKAKGKEELQLMTRVSNHPQLKNIRAKLIIETILLAGFLLIYNDIFDGAHKPLWVNVALGVSAGLFVLNDIAVYFFLHHPISGNNLSESVKKFMIKLKQMAVFSVVTSLIFGSSVILFFASTINFTNTKYLLLAGMFITLLVFLYLSYRNWLFRVRQIQKVIREFDK